jgi:hypothetical protein
MSLPPITELPPAPQRTDDPGTFSDKADAFVAALEPFREELVAFGEAIPAEVAPTNFNSTSTTSLAIGTGSKSLTVQTAKLYYVGQFVGLFSTASPTNFMLGQVTSYDQGTGALVVNVTTTSGAGTIAAWTVGPVTAAPSNARSRVYDWPSTSGTATFAAPTAANAASGDKRIIWIKDNGTSRTLSWNAIFRPFGSVALPTATTPNKWTKVGLEYNAVDSKWDVIALATEQ